MLATQSPAVSNIDTGMPSAATNSQSNSLTDKQPVSASFLTINGESLTIEQVFAYLQLFGRMQPFVQEFLRYYILYQEIQKRDDIQVTAAELAQTIIDFRLKAELTDPGKFGQWLSNQGINYTLFEQQIIVALQLQKLKTRIGEAELLPVFTENQRLFDQIDIYYIVVSEEQLAQQIQNQIAAGASLEQIAEENPLDAEQKVIVKREVNRRAELREEIRTAIETDPVKELLGPIPMGKRWCLFRVEQIIPGVLDDAMKQDLQEQLFNQWLDQKLQTLIINSTVSSEPTEHICTEEA